MDKDKIVSEPFYSWHAHLFVYQRRKCVLVMNNVTRYNFIMVGLKKAEFNRFHLLMKEKIAENLIAEGFAQSLVEKYMEKIGEPTYTQTSDRSLIGQMNEMIWFAEMKMDHIEREIDDVEIDRVNRFLNDCVMTKLPQAFPRVAMREALEKL